MSNNCEWCEGTGCDECTAPTTTNALAGAPPALLCDFCEGEGCDECDNGFIHTSATNAGGNNNNNNNNNTSTLQPTGLLQTYSIASNASFGYTFSDHNTHNNSSQIQTTTNNNHNHNNNNSTFANFSTDPTQSALRPMNSPSNDSNDPNFHKKPGWMGSKTPCSLLQADIINYITYQIYTAATDFDVSMNEAEMILRAFEWDEHALSVFLFDHGLDQLRQEHKLPAATPTHYNNIYDIPVSQLPTLLTALPAVCALPPNTSFPTVQDLYYDYLRLYHTLRINNVRAMDASTLLGHYDTLKLISPYLLQLARGEEPRGGSSNNNNNNNNMVMGESDAEGITTDQKEPEEEEEEEFLCLACQCDYPREEIYRFPCGHNVCKDCLPIHVETKLAENGSSIVSAATCPGTFLVDAQGHDQEYQQDQNNNGIADQEEYHFNNIDTKCHYPLPYSIMVDVFQEMDMATYLIDPLEMNDGGVDGNVMRDGDDNKQQSSQQQTINNNNNNNDNNNNQTNNTATNSNNNSNTNTTTTTNNNNNNTNSNNQNNNQNNNNNNNQNNTNNNNNRKKNEKTYGESFYLNDIHPLQIQPPSGPTDTTVLFCTQRVDTSDRMTRSGRYLRWLVDEYVHHVNLNFASSSSATTTGNNNFNIATCKSSRSCGQYIFIPRNPAPPSPIPVVEYSYTFTNPQNRTFLCPCGTFNCLQCDYVGIHFPAPCNIAHAYTEKTDPDYLTKKLIEGTTKACPTPGCGVKITKVLYCNHISCSNCQKHWCWLCKGPWSLHTRNYTCKVGISGKLTDEAQAEDHQTQVAIAETQRITYYGSYFKQVTKQLTQLLEGYYNMVYHVEQGDKIHAQLESLPKFRDGMRQLYVSLSLLQWSYSILFFLQTAATQASAGTNLLLLRQSQAFAIQYTTKVASLIIQRYLLHKDLSPLLDSIRHQEFNNFRSLMVNYTEKFSKRCVEYDFRDVLNNYDADMLTKERMEMATKLLEKEKEREKELKDKEKTSDGSTTTAAATSSSTTATTTTTTDKSKSTTDDEMMPNRTNSPTSNPGDPATTTHGTNNGDGENAPTQEDAMNWACTLCNCVHIPAQTDLIFDQEDLGGDEQNQVVDITLRTRDYLKQNNLKSGRWNFQPIEKDKLCRFKGVLKNHHGSIVCANCFACFKHNEPDCRLCYPLMG